MEKHPWRFLTSAGERFPQHGYREQIIWGRMRRTGLQLMFCNITQISPDSTTLTLCPRTTSWKHMNWEQGFTHVLSSQSFLPGFLVGGSFLQALKEVSKANPKFTRPIEKITSWLGCSRSITYKGEGEIFVCSWGSLLLKALGCTSALRGRNEANGDLWLLSNPNRLV